MTSQDLDGTDSATKWNDCAGNNKSNRLVYQIDETPSIHIMVIYALQVRTRANSCIPHNLIIKIYPLWIHRAFSHWSHTGLGSDFSWAELSLS